MVKLDERCALPDLRAASLDDPGIEMGEVEKVEVDAARRRSVADPSKASVVVVVVLLSRLEEDEGVDPPEDWVRSRRPNSVLYMIGEGFVATEAAVAA